MTERHRARMVPELLVSDLSRSLAFWMDLCGFEIVYRREDEGFVYLDLEGAQFMLEEVRGDDNWITAPLEGAARPWHQLRDHGAGGRTAAGAPGRRRLASVSGTAGALVPQRCD